MKKIRKLFCTIGLLVAIPTLTFAGHCSCSPWWENFWLLSDYSSGSYGNVRYYYWVENSIACCDGIEYNWAYTGAGLREEYIYDSFTGQATWFVSYVSVQHAMDACC